MITGKIENKTVWVPLYVWEQVADWPRQDIGAWPLQVCASALVNGGWMYCAWVSTACRRAEWIEFDADELFWTEAEAVRADAIREINKLKNLAGLTARTVKNASQSGFFVRFFERVQLWFFPAKNHRTGRRTS